MRSITFTNAAIFGKMDMVSVFVDGNLLQRVDIADKFKLGKIDVPVLVQYKLLGIVALQAGPSFCVMTNTSGTTEGMQWNIKRPTIGYAAGVEVEVWKIGISARYNGSFKKSEVLGYSTGSNRINTIQLGLGFYF